MDSRHGIDETNQVDVISPVEYMFLPSNFRVILRSTVVTSRLPKYRGSTYAGEVTGIATGQKRL
jgi:hypothetical protein